MSEFQQQVNGVQAPAVAGDFCDANPRVSYNAGKGALVAGAAGLTVGLFAWVTMDADGQPYSAVNSGAGVPQGFVHREQQGLITTYLDGAGMTVPEGFPVTLHTHGGFWMKNETGGAVAVGDAVFTTVADGKFSATAAGAGLADSGWVVASAGADDELVKIVRQ